MVQTVGVTAANRAIPLVAVGGIGGAFVRWALLDLTSSIDARAFVLLAINVVGAAIVGWLGGKGFEPAHYGEDQDSDGQTIWPLMSIGFCGGLTSFASFTLDIAQRLDSGDYTNAATLTFLTVVLTVGAAGFVWRRSWLRR